MAPTAGWSTPPRRQPKRRPWRFSGNGTSLIVFDDQSRTDACMTMHVYVYCLHVSVCLARQRDNAAGVIVVSAGVQRPFNRSTPQLDEYQSPRTRAHAHARTHSHTPARTSMRIRTQAHACTQLLYTRMHTVHEHTVRRSWRQRVPDATSYHDISTHTRAHATSSAQRNTCMATSIER